MFDELKVVGFANELKKESEFLFDVTFDDNFGAGENENKVTKDTKEEPPETEKNLKFY